ncbi:MAG: hypothetical protein E6J43_01810 [Chloroflexi bacterium]|nr:MAG: hypothetical protein E6J43_01810 [Chloroflexota bacterium]
MKRIAVLVAAIAALLLVFAFGEGGGLQGPKAAEATTSTWIWPVAPSSYTVPGGNQALENTETVFSLPCTNCWITRLEPELIYQGDASHPDGTVANYNNNSTTDGVWLHHFVIVDGCNLTNRIIASGNERTILQDPPGYGYFIGPGCSWILNYHIHNSGSNARHVAIRLNVTYQTTALPSAVPVWLDVSSNVNSEYTIPTLYSDKHTGDSGMHADYTMSLQGKIIGMGGHVHDYGISVSAFNTGAGDRPDDWICTSVSGYGTGSVYLPTGGPGTPGHPVSASSETLKAGYQQDGGANRYHIQGMTACNITNRMSIICPGDVIRLHTQYNNTSGFPVVDAMGIMVMYLATPPNVPDANNNGTWDGCEATNQDSDADGYPDRVEAVVGTAANARCGANSWPSDIDSNGFSDITDLTFLTGNFGVPIPPAPDRYGIGGNLPDAFIDITDVSRMTADFGRPCPP